MELKLLRTTTIKELKETFTRQFPYLKMEFFQQIHGKKQGSVLQQKIADNMRLCDIVSWRKEGVFSYDKTGTVADFEQQMQNEFGLPVQVYRKAGILWIQTIGTDHLSLDKQNNMGQVASKPMTFNLNNLFL